MSGFRAYASVNGRMALVQWDVAVSVTVHSRWRRRGASVPDLAAALNAAADSDLGS